MYLRIQFCLVGVVHAPKICCSHPPAEEFNTFRYTYVSISTCLKFEQIPDFSIPSTSDFDCYLREIIFEDVIRIFKL